jgi:hypothetical protein
MSRIIVGVFSILALTFTAVSADVIAIYGDAVHTDCNVIDDPDDEIGQIVFYVFHYSASGARGSRFKAPYQTCLAEYEFVFDGHPFAGTLGNSQNGVEIPYGTCLSGWIHILTIYYYDPSNLGSPSCCQYPVLPHPSSPPGQIESLDCANVWIESDAAPAIVNVTASCPCAIPTGVLDEDAKWGTIKALFRNE